jgi:putative transcription factor
MGECELCGAVKVSVRRVQTGKTEVAACTRCVDKMNLAPKSEAPGLSRARNFATAPTQRKKQDLMSRGSKELAEDFHKRISNARNSRQWSQQQLAKKMAETVNVVKSAESGKQPTDAVIRKFESILGIELMIEREPSETRFINSGPSRGMTFGDYLNDLR